MSVARRLCLGLLSLALPSVLTLLLDLSQAAAQDRRNVEQDHRARIEQLKRLDQKHDQFGFAVHTLIVPAGAVPNYNFPIPVARVRYESVPLFGFNEDKPAPAAIEIIKDLSRQFGSDKSLLAIGVVGHTDSIGSDKYNDDLSHRRAVAVATWLQVFGVVDKKVLAIGMGKSHSIATNATEQGRSLNRRVEFFLSSIPAAITPSVERSRHVPAFRNSHLPSCASIKEGSPIPPECAGPTIEKKDVVEVDRAGRTRIAGPPVVVDRDHPKVQAEEIPERESVPVLDDIREVPR